MKVDDFLKERYKILEESTNIQKIKSNDYSDKDDAFIAFKISKIAGITPEQAILSNQIRLKDLMTNDYLNDTYNPNFRTISNMFFD